MLSNVVSTWKLQYGPDANDVRGKTILILGDGNGGRRMTAQLLASCGARVFLAARSSTALDQTLGLIRQHGDEGDGMVLDIRGAQEARQFFVEAESRYGQIHAVINYLPLDGELLEARTEMGGETEDSQNAITQEALHYLQTVTHGQIINIGQSKNRADARMLAAALRRQAKELGIRITLIEPGETQDSNVEDIVQCVFRSLVQPFGVDVIFMHGEVQD